MWPSVRLWGPGLFLAIAACDRPGPARSNDTVPTPPPPHETTAVQPTPAPPAWDDAAGPIFLVVGPTAQQAALIVPSIDTAVSIDTVNFDTDSFRPLKFDLFSSGRRVGSGGVGTAVKLDIPEDCSAWPIVRLRGADSASAGWSVAMPAGRFEALGVDSIGQLARADSLRLVSDIARIASAAPGDTVSALRGLPFVVRRASRALLPGGTALVITEVGRSLNQEANPIQEHLLLIAERDSGATSYRNAYLERTSGGEETLESTEVLLVGLLSQRAQPVILLARYVGDGVVYSLLERQSSGKWRLRWSSPYAGC